MRLPFFRLLVSITGLALAAQVAAAGGPGTPAASAAGADRVQPRHAAAPRDARAATDDWPQVDYNPGLTSFNSHETGIGPRNAGRLAVAWSVADTTTGCSSEYTCANSGGAVVGGVVYQSTSYGVFARDAATGALRWRAPLGTGTIGHGSPDEASFPAVGGGIVLVELSPIRSERTGIAALSAATGKTLWTKQTTSEWTPNQLTLVNGVLYVDFGEKLWAITARTGHVRWSRSGFSEPAVANGRVYVMPDASAYDLVALSAATGKTLWRFATSSVYAPAFAMVTGGVVYLGVGLHVYELNARTGRGGKVVNTGCFLRPEAAAVGNGIIYITCGGRADRTAWAEAFRTSTGKRRWRVGFGSVGGAVISAPVLANGVAYLEAFDTRPRTTTVEAVGAASGKKLWGAPLPSRTWAYLTVAEGKLFAALTTGMTAFAPRA